MPEGVYKATVSWQIFFFYKFSKLKDTYNHFKAPVSFNILMENDINPNLTQHDLVLQPLLS